MNDEFKNPSSQTLVVSKVKEKNTGTFGDIGLWSFDPMKIITTGDGGMIYCKDKKKAHQIFLKWKNNH